MNYLFLLSPHFKLNVKPTNKYIFNRKNANNSMSSSKINQKKVLRKYKISHKVIRNKTAQSLPNVNKMIRYLTFHNIEDFSKLLVY